MLNANSMTLPRQLTSVQKTARSLLFKSLHQLSVGCLTVVESYGEAEGQDTFYGGEHHDLHAVIEIHHPGFFLRVARGGSIAAAEAYMDGWWDSPNLTRLMELMARNLTALDDMERRSSWLTRLTYRVGHWLNRNTLQRSKQNIHAHYDLGNSLYETFLDHNMLYSSGVYLIDSDTLEQAQNNKMARLCEQLKLSADDHVIEIGTGWGAMAIYMAKHFGCQVTTTTISDEQYLYTQEAVAKAGLEDRITLLKRDYRELAGQYDKLVSIEMIEAVGREFLQSYIQKCQSLLKPGGLMAIQAITIADQRYDYYADNVDFIQKYIFPGGFLPSITALTSATTRHSDLVLRDLFDIGSSYARTLADWRQRFDQAEMHVRALGYDERFIRMWRYYFCYCEGGFLARSISTVHMTFERP
ncbi:SAM-dependent methyltransferase [Vibrio sp. V39_P1S14PM300]|uniref:SAM-dependent methyltransferase n=1 Tax=Vibrio sp. V39_P1S14PM300 TaxID=1938690 RepID=UPI0013737A36|nr:cyclopropane-fatty-acyl-phospholipid synthase family protein [Vibrio sp. V39_P1S14PM300]NAX20066.1 methyltransferase domain-containing protein [Vibrio sp. V39_P1S14PM300]